MAIGTQLLGLSRFNSPQQILEQFGKQGNGSFRFPANLKNLGALRGTSVLSLADRTTSQFTAQSNIQSQIQSSLTRTISRLGNTYNIQTQQTVNGNISNQYSQTLSQVSQKQVEGKVNGRPVFSNTEVAIRQLTTGSRDTAFVDNRQANQLLTRNVERSGNVVTVNTRIDTQNQGNLNMNTQVNRVTDTERRVRTFDRDGNVTGDRFGRQIVTVNQQSSLEQARRGTGTRDIQQNTTVTANNEGNANVRLVRTDVTDTAQSQQVINTGSQSRTDTRVDNLDADGNLLATRQGSQLVSTNEIRTIDVNRQTTGENSTKVSNAPGKTEVVSHGGFETNATVTDTTQTAGTVQNLNGEGVLVNERAFERNVTAVTTEHREGDNNARTVIERDGGVTTARTEVNSREGAEINTSVTAAQGGLVTERTIDTQGALRTRGELENRVDAEGNRVVTFEAERQGRSETRDLVQGPNGQGRLVETETRTAQGIQGELRFNPETGQVGNSQNAASGGVVVEFGTNTGLRSNFKLDNGVLTFDFTASRAVVTDQETATGQVVTGANGQTSIAGQPVSSSQGVGETVRFQGRVVSSVDAEGNRILTLEGSAVNEGFGARTVGSGHNAGAQIETRRTDLDFNGRLAVNRETSTDGVTTTTNTNTSAELNINKVENREAAGVNVRTLTPLTTSDGVRAGFTAYNNNSLGFNFGAFSLRISLVA